MDIALLLLRVGLGAILFCHATQKALGWFHGPGLETAAAVFEQLGQRPGRQKVLLAATCEIVAGTLLVAGCATIAGAAIAAGTLIVAAGCSILKQRAFWAAAGGGEYPLVLAFVAVCIGIAGAGKYAVDAFLFSSLPSYDGAIALLAALLAAAPPLLQSARALSSHKDDNAVPSSNLRSNTHQKQPHPKMRQDEERMPTIERLAHVGVFIHDADSMVRFYRDVLGLHLTDVDEKAGLYFLSSRPDEEHHELLLCAGRTSGPDERWLQQISFKCPTLDDVIEFYRRLVENRTPIEYTVSHGNAIGVYFYDPEGNRAEVYWNTGLKARQGYLLEVNLDDDAELIKTKVAEHVAQYSETGYIDTDLLARQNIS